MASSVVQFEREPRKALSVVIAAVESFPRYLLEDLIECAITRLDELDGDCDLEPNGDAEPDAGAHRCTYAEDQRIILARRFGHEAEIWRHDRDEGGGR